MNSNSVVGWSSIRLMLNISESPVCVEGMQQRGSNLIIVIRLLAPTLSQLPCLPIEQSKLGYNCSLLLGLVVSSHWSSLVVVDRYSDEVCRCYCILHRSNYRLAVDVAVCEHADLVAGLAVVAFVVDVAELPVVALLLAVAAAGVVGPTLGLEGLLDELGDIAILELDAERVALAAFPGEDVHNRTPKLVKDTRCWRTQQPQQSPAERSWVFAASSSSSSSPRSVLIVSRSKLGPPPIAFLLVQPPRRIKRRM